MHDFRKAVGIPLGVQTRCHLSRQESPLPSASSASRKKVYIMTENTSVYNNALGQRMLFGSINFSVLINGQVWFHFCLSYLEKQQMWQQFVTVKEIQSENTTVRPELCSALKTTIALETFSSNWAQPWAAEKCVELSPFHVTTWKRKRSEYANFTSLRMNASE